MIIIAERERERWVGTHTDQLAGWLKWSEDFRNVNSRDIGSPRWKE